MRVVTYGEIMGRITVPGFLKFRQALPGDVNITFAGAEDVVSDPVTHKAALAASSAPAIQLWYDQYLPPTVATAHLDGFQEVMGLTKTPAQAQAEMQAAMEEYNAKK